LLLAIAIPPPFNAPLAAITLLNIAVAPGSWTGKFAF